MVIDPNWRTDKLQAPRIFFALHTSTVALSSLCATFVTHHQDGTSHDF